MSDRRSIIVSGSSITNDGPWPTWFTWVRRLYGFDTVVDLSVKGLGNKVIIMNAVRQAHINDPELILLQLTSVDKWDWYVQNEEKYRALEQEKHPIFKLHPKESKGFWCTGSHFPLWKQYYREHYFSIDYQAFETLMMLQWFKFVCDQKRWKYYIILDSPIFSVTESQLNNNDLQKNQCHSTTLIENSLCSIVEIDLKNIYLPGLIGYACLNDLPWFHEKFKSHPGSLVHFEFVKSVVSTELDLWFDRCVDAQDLEHEAVKFQTLVA